MDCLNTEKAVVEGHCAALHARSGEWAERAGKAEKILKSTRTENQDLKRRSVAQVIANIA